MIYLAAAAVFLLDRLAKFMVLKNMCYGQSLKVLPNIFHITFVLNNGTAFGLFKNRNAYLMSISFLVIVFLILYIRRNMPKRALVQSALGLILGGAFGNIFDRIVLGNVVDFLDFRIWPVFNIADSAITVGGIILAIAMLRLHKVT